MPKARSTATTPFHALDVASPFSRSQRIPFIGDLGSFYVYSPQYEAGRTVVGSVSPLFGRSVLIVEDEPLIALELHGALHKAGASIPAATSIKEALTLIARAPICAAVVDVNLGGHDCSSVCAALTKRATPFMFYTGYLDAPRYRFGLTRQRSTDAILM